MMNRNGEAAMDMVNVTLSVTKMLDRALETHVDTGRVDADKYAFQLGYCEGTLRDFIHRVMMEVGEERAVELMERTGIRPVYSAEV
jgi:hypothetical protein